MKEEQHRARRIFALNEHPLAHTVDFGERLLRGSDPQWAALLLPGTVGRAPAGS